MQYIEEVDRGSSKYRCTLCNVYGASQADIESHLRGSKHAKNVPEHIEWQGTSPWCVLCKCKLPGGADIKRHCAGRPHQKALAAEQGEQGVITTQCTSRDHEAQRQAELEAQRRQSELEDTVRQQQKKLDHQKTKIRQQKQQIGRQKATLRLSVYALQLELRATERAYVNTTEEFNAMKKSVDDALRAPSGLPTSASATSTPIPPSARTPYVARYHPSTPVFFPPSAPTPYVAPYHSSTPAPIPPCALPTSAAYVALFDRLNNAALEVSEERKRVEELGKAIHELNREEVRKLCWSNGNRKVTRGEDTRRDEKALNRDFAVTMLQLLTLEHLLFDVRNSLRGNFWMNPVMLTGEGAKLFDKALQEYGYTNGLLSLLAKPGHYLIGAHGTAIASALCILDVGFDPAKRKRRAHGEGEYFDLSSTFCVASDDFGQDGHYVVALIVTHTADGAPLRQIKRVRVNCSDILVVNNPTPRSYTLCLPFAVARTSNRFARNSNRFAYLNPFAAPSSAPGHSHSTFDMLTEIRNKFGQTEVSA